MNRTRPFWYEHTKDFNYVVRCTCCDRWLNGRVRMLELDHRTMTYHDLGGVPPDKSQGWFPFGISCARRLVAEVTP